MTEPLLFLHLSDIHFLSLKNGQLEYDSEVRNELFLDATKDIKQHFAHAVNGILITGDIAYHGLQEEYEVATNWLNSLCEGLGCPSENVWVVPGNHDVNRRITRESKIITSIHKEIQSSASQYVDSAIGPWISDNDGLEALLKPFALYNDFAGKYSCSTTPNAVSWLNDIPLNDGSTLRIIGFNSAFICGSATEEKGKLVVGAFQRTKLLREPGITYLSMCHHPTDWLLDGDDLSDVFNNKVSIQLYGHKHRQRITQIEHTLIISSGATQPSREEQGWQPRYNFIQLEVTNNGPDRKLSVSVWPRVWADDRHKFRADFDDEGRPVRNYTLILPEWVKPSVNNSHSSNAPMTSQNNSLVNHVVTNQEDSSEVANMYTERRLIYRFLGLTYSRILKIAASLDLISDEDKLISEVERKQRYYLRAKERDLLKELNEQVERHYSEMDRNP